MLPRLGTNENLVDPATRQNYPLAQHDERINVQALAVRGRIPGTKCPHLQGLSDRRIQPRRGEHHLTRLTGSRVQVDRGHPGPVQVYGRLAPIATGGATQATSLPVKTNVAFSVSGPFARPSARPVGPNRPELWPRGTRLWTSRWHRSPSCPCRLHRRGSRCR